VPSVRERRPDVSPHLDAVIRRAMAKDPRDRFRSMDELCGELAAGLEPEGSASGAQTMVVAPPRKPTRRERRAARPPAGRPSIWPLILLLAGLAVLAGILAAVFAFTGAKDTITGGGTKTAKAAATAVPLTGVSSYDPEGDNKVEHPEAVSLAADGDPNTFWTTEHYDSGQLNKSGVGVVLDAGSTKQLTEMTVKTDTVGFTAQIKAGPSSSGPFTPVSSSRTVGSSTTFTLDHAHARYYLVWITDLGGLQAAHVNEVTAKGS
jgi:hypothetical protein